MGGLTKEYLLRRAGMFLLTVWLGATLIYIIPRLAPGDLDFTHVLKDIQSLNEIAMTTREYDVTAISFHAYAYIADHYALLPHGASIGDGYGPIVVARDSFPATELKDKKIGVPGKLTSAFLALRLHTPEFAYEVIHFDQITEAVLAGSFTLTAVDDAGSELPVMGTFRVLRSVE